ncbi:MAG: fused MFS/spermidine synthase [Myxococcota bacterium]
MSDRRRRRRASRPRVEVREGRHGRELIVDGTFASLYVPGRVASGPVWDALAAPILALPPGRRRSVLVLGLGGGSAARLVRGLAPSARIVGVELDPEVVSAARRWFDLDALGIEVEIADARAFLSRDHRRFDVVLEDVFVGSGDAVHKPRWMCGEGLVLAARRVARGGLLVSNALDEARHVRRVLQSLYASVVRIDVEDYDNRIFVGGPATLRAATLRAALAATPELSSSLSQLSLRTLPAAAPRSAERGNPTRPD